MAINAQSGVGKIRLFNDFFGVGDYLARTDNVAPLKDFYAGGNGFSTGDAGIAYKQSDALSGVVTITSGNAEPEMTFVGTDICFDIGLMAPFVMEARVRLPDLGTKAIFVGLTSVCTLDEEIDDIIDNNGSTTIALTAGSLCGFYLSSELTALEDWHMVFKGGATTGQTDSTAIDTDVKAVQDEWQILRLEVDNNGTARWYIDEKLLQTQIGAISTSTDLAAIVACGANTSEFCIMDLDYLLVTANRDWNA